MIIPQKNKNEKTTNILNFLWLNKKGIYNPFIIILVSCHQ